MEADRAADLKLYELSKARYDRKRNLAVRRYGLITVNPEEWFNFIPRLSRTPAVARLSSDPTLLDMCAFSVIDIGDGLVEVHQAALDLDHPRLPIDEPAGGVRPVRYEVILEDLTREKLRNIGVGMGFRGEIYYGRTGSFDKDELRVRGLANMDIGEWREVGGRYKIPYYPPDENILGRVEFQVFLKP